MTDIPATVARVERMVVCTPPSTEWVRPAMLYSANLAGADETCSLDGMQALTVVAYVALPDLAPVDMIVSAGNKYVTEAER